MKVISRTLLVFLVIITIAVIRPQFEVKADQTPMGALGEINPDNPTSETTSGMTTVVNKLLGFLQIASALLAVVMIAVTGFRYIIETPEMKNELKKSMIPIIVGILLVFFAASIAQFFIGMFNTGTTG